MATYTDATTSEHTLIVTIGKLRTLKQCGIDLLGDDAAVLENVDKTFANMESVCKMLYVFDKDQHEEQAFYDAIDADSFERGTRALVEALKAFFQKARRPALVVLCNTILNAPELEANENDMIDAVTSKAIEGMSAEQKAAIEDVRKK